MAAYTIKNLRELEDSAAKAGFGENFEARFARIELGCEQTGLSYQKLAPNAGGPFGHKHGEDEEVYVVVSGSGSVELDDEVRDLRAYDAIRVAPGTVRAFVAGPQGLELLAFGTHTENDALIQQVDWP